MLIIKYNSGSLGHFLASVILKLNPISIFAHDGYASSFVLHTGAYTNPDDISFKKKIKTNYYCVTHNNPYFEEWIYNFKNAKNIFIDLDSNFIEYRLNYIFKNPDWNEKLNNYAKDSWKNLKNPVACDEARRVVRLHKKLEQQIKPHHDDIIFKFKNFYIENKKLWVKNFIEIGKKLSIDFDIVYFEKWYESFRKGQEKIIERANFLYTCIKNKKFDNSLNENEKGIIIGYHAVKNNIDNPEYFEQKYYEFFKN